MAEVRRAFVEKKSGFDIAAKKLFSDLKGYLGISSLKGVRQLIRYDIEGLSEKDYQASLATVLSEPPVDTIVEETMVLQKNETAIAIEYLPGQYDQRADSAAQCIQMMTQGVAPLVRVALVIVLKGKLSDNDVETAKRFLINPVDSHEASLEKPLTLVEKIDDPPDVPVLRGFIGLSAEDLSKLGDDLGLAMSPADLQFCQTHFSKEEKRDPTLTEIRVLDTYWSDHCRHTTFLSEIKSAKIHPGKYSTPIEEAYERYLKARLSVYQENEKPKCLMDIALMGMKELRAKGLLEDQEISDEINACSIMVEADINGKKEDWLVMFKNETHNHPTEIEPFGGAATCLGGAIRDPLSGRSYVYQAMRITGSGDPRKKIKDTIAGKLPQRKISVEAAQGYSSYGNQIGLATGIVNEIYHEGYVAKRMEIGAVIAAAPKTNVVREKPVPGDVVVLVGGRTGRDGCGGATGSSKKHTLDSIIACGAEVQKGNPPTERKIQRLFRNAEVSRMIKKCNDFGAGGVSVAIGELADGLDIDLDAVPKKYEGLDGTELAISESQERMAVLISPNNLSRFIEFTTRENLESIKVAEVTKSKRVKMTWRGDTIVDLSRAFIDTNGVRQETSVEVTSPQEKNDYFATTLHHGAGQSHSLSKRWHKNLEAINVCSQRGLSERFDSTIGAGSCLLPFGGLHQATPALAMAAKLPVLNGDTTTGTLMSWGFNPGLACWSPFHGAVFAVVESVAKVVAAGGDYRKIRLTLQEYFEKLGIDPKKWGKPFGALLGAFLAQNELSIAAIGGKDSMSGSFEQLSVPPALASFAVCPVDVRDVVSPEFKKRGSTVVYLPLMRTESAMPDFSRLRENFFLVHELVTHKKILSAHTIGEGGIAAAVTKMALGNMIGMHFDLPVDQDALFAANFGSLMIEIREEEDIQHLFEGKNYAILGKTTARKAILINGESIDLHEAKRSWEKALEGVFPTKTNEDSACPNPISYSERISSNRPAGIAKPRILIPIFPGTNCEYDTAKQFELAGGIVDQFIINNLTPKNIEESLNGLVKHINRAQIIMIPGGFSAGDEPEGSGKFIAAVFRNSAISDAVMSLLKERDGLMLGICNGFQALIKLGLVPYGDIRDIGEQSPTLTFNTIGRHVSRMVRTRVCSVLSPWLAEVNVGDVHTIPVSHGEGRFVASASVMKSLEENGQVATQYVDLEGQPTMDVDFNPNGSEKAIEGITSPDGKIFGKMGHSERIGENVAKNIIGEKDQKIFRAGVRYFN